MAIFGSLLNLEGKFEEGEKMTDDTVEGAVTLLSKVGYLLDDKKRAEEEKKVPAEEKKGKGSKNLDFEPVVKRFHDLVEGDEISNRVKLLIKNMLENRAQGWAKARKQDQQKPKKVAELHDEIKKKQMEAEMEAAYGEEDDYYDDRRGRGGRERGGGSQYIKKGAGRGSQQPAFEKQGSRYQKKEEEMPAKVVEKMD